MSSKPKTSPPGLSIPKGNSRRANSGQNSYPSNMHEFVDLPSRITQDSDCSKQDLFCLSPSLDGPNCFTSTGQWPFNDGMMLPSELGSASDCTETSFDSMSLPKTEYDAPGAGLLDFISLSHPAFPGPTTLGHSDQPCPSELSQLPESGANARGAFSSSQGQQSSMAFAFDNEPKNESSANNGKADRSRRTCYDANSGESLMGWDYGAIGSNDMPGVGVSQMSNVLSSLPASPPHTKAGSGSSSGSQTAYQSSFLPAEDAMFVDLPDTASLSNQTFSLGEPYYPLTPPLCGQDSNRTIRQSSPQRMPIPSATSTQQPENPEADSSSLAVDALGHSPELRSPRDHHYYSLPTRSDGKYHCPYSTGEKPCTHPPTTQKCAYHKYLDSHLKPYRCKVPQCVDAHFSSNACLFRHEREAHGMHGHGENPHLCLFASCERSIPGNGFPRRWNLHDHMKRVHDFATSDKGSSPEPSPVVTGQPSKKKDSAVRKRKGTRASGGQTMKRGRSNQSQGGTVTVAGAATAHAAAAAVQSQPTNCQQLQKAEQNYYDCLSRLRDDLNNMNPQDPSLHDKANASLQELHTLGLNYRFIRAGQVGADRYSS